jgi:hypothetical protein
MPSAWVVAALISLAGQSAAPAVTVYFAAEGTASTYAARRLAAATLARAGVGVVWRGPRLRPSEIRRDWLRVELVEATPGRPPDPVLAVSYPRARCSKGITVYLDAIRETARGTNRESALLAYVLVHEIAHVVQGVCRHSQTGVMKARWGGADRAAIFEGRLAFDDDDIRLMREGLARDWCGEPAVLTRRASDPQAQGPPR